MSNNKFEIKKSNQERKSASHQESWREEIDQSIGRSSRELGIYDERAVVEKLKAFFGEIIEMKELEFIEEIKKISREAGVFLVGGSVRDAVLGKMAKDIDLIINQIDPIDLVDILQKYGKVIFDRNPKADLCKMEKAEKEALIKNSYGVIKFMPKNTELPEPIDIALPREDDYSEAGQSGIRGIKRDTESKADPNLPIARDLARRDLTINAMAINLVNGDIYDPFDGIESLVKKEIKTVGNSRERILAEDLSRGFRAIRFACVFGAGLDSETKKAVKEIFTPSEKTAGELYGGQPEVLKSVLAMEEKIRKLFKLAPGRLPKCLQIFWDKEQKKPRMAVPRETMGKEILKAIGADPKKFIQLMDEVGGLKIIFPELEALKGLEQPREHHSEGDVFRHTTMLLDNLPRDASLRLKLAGLFHDIGKASTQSRNEKGKITFYGHDDKSERLFHKIAARFTLGNKIRDDAAWLIKNHMFPISESALEARNTTIEKKFLKNLLLAGELISLSKADALASVPENGPPNLETINKLAGRIQELKKLSPGGQGAEIPPLITGRDLTDLGLKPGPMFKDLLEKIRNAQLAGAIKNKDEALIMAKELIVEK